MCNIEARHIVRQLTPQKEQTPYPRKRKARFCKRSKRAALFLRGRYAGETDLVMAPPVRPILQLLKITSVASPV